MAGYSFILLIQLFIFIPVALLVILGIYALILAIKALSIYIRNNS